ncbi:MAG: aldo/keto reductase [Rhodobacteraceae bacterium]|nr:aldo/keto reductase [Paracoccaceae bacterium]
MPFLPSAMAAETPILTRPIPKTGEQLPMMGLGTSSSFRSADTQARRDVIAALIDGGASLIDTAPSYGDAEDATGDVIASLGNRDKVFLATKVAERGADAGIASIENSFKVLQTDVIDLMQVHNLVDTNTQLGAIRDMKAAGRIRYSGVTHWRPDAQEALADVMSAEDVDFVQFNYSVDVRQPENRLLPMAQDKGIAVLINVPLGRGRLLEAVKGREVPAWARDLGCDSFAQMLLKFVLSHPAVTCAIPATSKVRHINDNLNAARGRLPDAKERERIAEYWANA